MGRRHDGAEGQGMNPYSILAAVAVFASLLVWGTWERSQAIQARADLSTLKASYATVAAAAETHAQAVEAKQDAAIKAKTESALTVAATAASKANVSKAAYDAKLKELAKQKPADLPHICANVAMPGDLK